MSRLAAVLRALADAMDGGQRTQIINNYVCPTDRSTLEAIGKAATQGMKP